MGNKKYIYLPILALLTVMLAGVVYGACTFETPTSGTILNSTTTIFNITCATNQNISNCSVSASSSTSGDSFSFYTYNTTASKHTNLSTLDITVYQDATDWSFSGTCYNGSEGTTETITALSSMTIDSTVPVAESTSPATNSVNDDNNVSFWIQCHNTTSATLNFRYIGSGGNDLSYPMTVSSSGNCTYDKTFLSNGGYTWYYTMTDGYNTTTSSDFTLTQRTPGGYIPETPKAGSTTTSSGGGMNKGLLFLIIAAAVLMFAGKGKKRRKK